MPKVIGGAYAVLEKLGAGGGGTVYLAEHLRLNKKVAVKADKRKLSADMELLRREVDILKNLSHPYIPQVYDFFPENDTVYTVMDFIDGESLDKALKRGERFPQPQVIRWARQLLQALCYLHSPTHGAPPHGYVHSDIKPANLMRRRSGDICLIDFNISLALGVEGAIGASAGYASPEHYGLDFSSGGTTVTKDGSTLTLTLGRADATATLPEPSTPRRAGVVPDVRSDIYSTGATLYHLLSGRRPARDALAVEPLSPAEASPQVAAIVAKAMRPNPELRYQTAQEMLEAFERLHENDPRAVRFRRQARAIAAALSILFLGGSACAFTGLKQMEHVQAEARLAAEQAETAERLAKEALSDITSAEEALRRGDRPAAVRFAAQALAQDTPYAAQAQAALTEALGVYDLSDGFRTHRLLELPSAPIKAAFSPGGTRIAVLTSGLVQVFDTETGETLAALPADISAQSDVVFTAEDAILYAGEGALRAYDIAQEQELWTGEAALEIALSADRSTAAAVSRDGSGTAIYQVGSGDLLQTVSFGGRLRSTVANDVFADNGSQLLCLNGDGSWLAASFADGGLLVFDLCGGENDLELFDFSEFTRFEGGFYSGWFAFSAAGAEQSIFAVIDLEAMAQTGGSASNVPYHVQADESGVYISQENILVRIHPVTGEQDELAYTAAEISDFAVGEVYTATANADGTFSIFDANANALGTYDEGGSCDFVLLAGGFAAAAGRDTPALLLLKQEERQEADLFAYDAGAPHDEARISADGKTAMLFRYDGFRLYGSDGLLAEVEIPDAGQVYDQQYQRDETGSRLEVIYNSGLVRSYSAEDGRLLSEYSIAPPGDSLDEEFWTDRLRIDAPLHGVPAAYDRETGELVRELESEDYLAYAVQAGEYVIAQYVSTQGDRYGLLMNAECETLARLPGLCDVLPDGTLVFDDQSGHLRTSHIYSKNELLALVGQ